MARTRSGSVRAGRGGEGRGGGRGRGAGRGEGGGEPHVEQPQNAPNPELIAMITQVVNAVLAQTAAAGGQPGGTGGQDGHNNEGVLNEGNVAGGTMDLGDAAEQPRGGDYYENEEGDIRVGNVPRGPRSGSRRFVTYKNFKDCGAIEYDGRGGAVKLSQWLEKMEAVVSMSDCTREQRVKYVAGSFTKDALSWWNTQLVARTRRGAEGMSYHLFKELLLKKFCSPVELGRLEREFLELKMVGADHSAYTTRFYELSRLVPHLVTPDEKAIEKYLRGLVPQVRATMAAVRPVTLDEAVLRSEAMTDELVQDGVLKVVNINKRKESGESSGTKKVWGNHGKKQNFGKAFVAVDAERKTYTGPHPLCTRCNFHHPVGSKCMTCFNCQTVGHLAKNCSLPDRRLAPQNVVPLNVRRPPAGRGTCFVCGSPDHFRNACPQWVGQQVQVAVHPNQLQITGAESSSR